VGALVLFTDETENAEKAEENFQKTLQKGQIQRQRNIQLLQAQGKTEVEVAQASAKAAEDRFRMAQFYYLNTAKDAELFAKVEEEYETAKFERTLAQINLEQAQNRDRNKAADDLEENRQKEQQRLEIQRKIIADLLKLESERLKIQSRIPGSNIKILETEVEILKTLEKRLNLLKEYSLKILPFHNILYVYFRLLVLYLIKLVLFYYQHKT
jgi:hypothetical protein